MTDHAERDAVRATLTTELVLLVSPASTGARSRQLRFLLVDLREKHFIENGKWICSNLSSEKLQEATHHIKLRVMS